MYWKYENEEEQKRTKGMRVRERENAKENTKIWCHTIDTRMRNFNFVAISRGSNLFTAEMIRIIKKLIIQCGDLCTISKEQKNNNTKISISILMPNFCTHSQWAFLQWFCLFWQQSNNATMSVRVRGRTNT